MYLVSRGDWTGDAILHDKVSATDVEVLKGQEPTEIHGEERVTGLTVVNRADASKRNLEFDGVFIEIGMAASSDYVLDLLETNARGEIHVDRELETDVRGVFAAGAVSDYRDKQVIIAAAEGAKGVLVAFSYLVHQAYAGDVSDLELKIDERGPGSVCYFVSHVDDRPLWCTQWAHGFSCKSGFNELTASKNSLPMELRDSADS